jgi:uncharacterized membrane protein
MEWLENLEHALANSATLLKIGLEVISVLCVFLGIVAVVRVCPQSFRGYFPLLSIRLAFGRWLGLALEFQLGADILATTVSPSYASLGKLGALAVIRTFLNYFLSMELKEEIELKEKMSKRNESNSNIES